MPEPVTTKEAKVAEPIHHFSRVTARVADAFDEGLSAAKRAGKHSSDAAEEFFDDTQQRIKRHPFETVMLAFAGGFILGGFVDWLLRRR